MTDDTIRTKLNKARWLIDEVRHGIKFRKDIPASYDLVLIAADQDCNKLLTCIADLESKA